MNRTWKTGFHCALFEPGVPKRKFIESVESGGKMFAEWESRKG